MKKILILAFLLLFASSLAFSVDFGFLLDQNIEMDEDLLKYTPGLTPWFSWNDGQGTSVYLSALFSLKYLHFSGERSSSSGWARPLIVPELARCSVGYRFSPAVMIEAGRIGYADILGLTATGLFDGLRLEIGLPQGSLNVGAFYTGLLFKETAKVQMTAEDAANVAKLFDYDQFENYFTPKRALAFARWNMPVGDSNSLSAELLTQFDLTENTQKLNSQYGALKFDMYPMSMLRLTAGGVFEAMQYTSGDPMFAFGALAQVKTELPTAVSDWLGFTVKLGSGAMNDTITTFTPVSSNPQGSVFTGTLGGLAIIGLDYSAMLLHTLYAECALNYFLRTYDDPESSGNLYGAEFWATFVWQPLEDIRATLGAGAFFPGMGNIDAYGSDVLWKITAGISLSF
ncbi:MAG: hypothetical protein FWD40_08080 [Treponema sp.]|nr:hypothetical protein [Treponema sp.]